MIPTTITGILILLVLILPGFVYVSLRERHQPSHRLSVFRETSVVLAATLVSYLLPLALTILLAFLWHGFRDQLAAALSSVAAVQAAHPFRMIAFGLCWVLLGSVVAAILASKRVSGRWTAPRGGSAWWALFRPKSLIDEGLIEGQDYKVGVTATLDDGSTVTGMLYSWNRDGDDRPDRDLVLQAPLWVQAADSRKVRQLDAELMSFSARSIRDISVKYYRTQQEPELGPSDAQSAAG